MLDTTLQSDIRNLVHSLGRFPQGVLPAGVMREILAHGPAANETLLDRLDQGIDNVHGGLGAVPPECFFCYALLHANPDISMLATVQRLFELKTDDADRIIGALRSEFTPALILQMTDETNRDDILEWIDGLVRNSEVDAYNRWALTSLPARWFRAGLMARDEAIAQLKTWMEDCTDDESATMSAACVCELLDLNAYEERAYLQDCFMRGQIDEMIVDIGCFESGLSEDCQPSKSDAYDNIDDLVNFLSKWASFNQISRSLDHSNPEPTRITRKQTARDDGRASTDSEVRQWLAAIRKSNASNYPLDAVRSLNQHALEVGDRLVAEVQWGLEQCGTENARASNGPFLAATILAAQHSGPGMDVFLSVLDLPPDHQMDLVGDDMQLSVVHALSHRLSGDCGPIDQRIAEANRSELDRATLAMFYPMSVYNGFLTREDGIAKLLDLMERFGDSRDLSGGIYDALCLMSVPDSHPMMFAAREKGVENLFLSTDDARRCIDQPDEANNVIWELTRRTRSPESAIKASVMFDADALNPRPIARPMAAQKPQRQNKNPGAMPATIVNAAADRIPRNSPCPCGSGKKFKKCCRNK